MNNNSSQSAKSSEGKIFSRRPLLLQFATVLGIFLTIYALFGLLIMMQNESLLSTLALHPTVGSDDIDPSRLHGVKCESLFIPASGGSKLHAYKFTVPGADKIAIVNHGNAGNNAHRFYLASALTKAGINVILYDYQGYGVSTGAPTLHGILEDGDTVYEFVRNDLQYPPSRIIIYGESIGTAVSCHVAAHKACAGLILQSPIKSLPSAARFVFIFLRGYPDFIFPKPHLDNLELIPTIHCPILLLHGMKDKIVASNNSQELYDAANQPKSVAFLGDCGHNDMGEQNSDVFQGAIEKFIAGLK